MISGKPLHKRRVIGPSKLAIRNPLPMLSMVLQSIPLVVALAGILKAAPRLPRPRKQEQQQVSEKDQRGQGHLRRLNCGATGNCIGRLFKDQQYVCIYVCIIMHLYIYMIGICICICTCMCTCICTCICTCMHICVYISMSMCMNMCIYIYTIPPPPKIYQIGTSKAYWVSLGCRGGHCCQ